MTGLTRAEQAKRLMATLNPYEARVCEHHFNEYLSGATTYEQLCGAIALVQEAHDPRTFVPIEERIALEEENRQRAADAAVLGVTPNAPREVIDSARNALMQKYRSNPEAMQRIALAHWSLTGEKKWKLNP